MSFTIAEIEEFKTEAFELLDIAEKSLLGLDQGEDFKTCYNAIFRSFHNLKGGAGMMELAELSRHTHELETIFTTFQDKENIPFEYLNFFLNGVDAARLILGGQNISFSYEVNKSIPLVEIPKEEEALNLGSISTDEFLTSCSEYVENISQCLQAIEKGDAGKEVINDLYRYVHSLKGDAYLFSFNLVGEVTHAMETALEPIRDGNKVADKVLIGILFKSLDVIEILLNQGANANDNKGLVKIVDTISQALKKASTLGLTAESNVLVMRVETEVKENKEVETSNSSIRVPVSLLDSLMTLMGEMVLVRNQVLQYADKTEDFEFLSMSKRLNVVTSEIQEQMMKTRMQAIGNVLTRFNRVVRDLASELGKKITLNIQGAETELDKSLLEAIKDPLTHIVRNSCDHGIEGPEDRLAKGKSDTGKVEINAYHEGGQVFIEVSDDGKGLNHNSILAKAIEKNLITSSQAQNLSEKDVFDLIFLPGFSTASLITNVSGRGVGMDVVRTNIERIGGTVSLSGKENVGTVIKIKIPLTLAIIPALMVKCNNATFAIPQVKLEELVRVDLEENPNQIETLYSSAIYRLRGNLLQLVDMNGILDTQNKLNLKDRKIINIAVLNSDNHLFGLIIDDVLDTADIVVKPLNRILKSLQIYSGATILGDGSIALIFDVTGISKVAQISSGHKMIVEETSNKISDYQDFLLFELNSKTTHAISLNYIDRLEEFKKTDIEYTGQQMVIRYRENILPLIIVNDQLEYNKAEISDLFHVFVIERGGLSYGLIVNKIIDTLSTTKEVIEPISFHQGIIGNINNDDKLIVVIDPFQILDKSLGVIHQPMERKISIETRSKVLLVEDTVFFRRMIQGYLEKSGFDVLVAQDGQNAIEVLNKFGKEVSLIVSDIEMPRMNGFEMARAIRKYPQYKNLPMIAVSSKADKNYRNQGMSAGFDMYLEKLRPEVLLAAIDELTKAKRMVG